MASRLTGRDYRWYARDDPRPGGAISEPERPPRTLKLALVRALQKYLLNPPVRALMAIGLAPPMYALLETTGRKSGKRRVTPVGHGLVGDEFWIVTEHGRNAGYVKNIERNPRVRVKVRQGLVPRWREGTAHILPDDPPRERQRALSRRHPGRRLNAFVVRTVGTSLLSIRIDLDR